MWKPWNPNIPTNLELEALESLDWQALEPLYSNWPGTPLFRPCLGTNLQSCMTWSNPSIPTPECTTYLLYAVEPLYSNVSVYGHCVSGETLHDCSSRGWRVILSNWAYTCHCWCSSWSYTYTFWDLLHVHHSNPTSVDGPSSNWVLSAEVCFVNFTEHVYTRSGEFMETVRVCVVYFAMHGEPVI